MLGVHLGRDYNSTPPQRYPPWLKELIRTIYGLIRPNRVLNLGGYLWGGGGGYYCNPLPRDTTIHNSILDACT